VASPADPSLRYCETHDQHYGKIEQCSGCRAARSITVKTASPKADTRELELREIEYREADKFLRRIGKEWIDEGTAQERNAALKAFDAASKWARLALEIRQQRLEMEHDQWLVEQKRLLGGGGN
jgi:hypothetical protein